MTTIGIASPLPPARGGPADYVSHLLPFLTRHLRVVCLAPEPDAVDPVLRRAYEIRGLRHADDGDIDLVLYHVANNEWHRDVVECARNGPAGVAVLHDATVHNIYYDMFLHEGARDRYRDALAEAHGDIGAALADLRMAGHTGEMELYLFDMLEPLVARQRGAIVHSRYARDFVADRVPGLPVWSIPHYAIGDPHPVPREELGIPADRFIVTHLGIVTRSKRPDLLIAAATELIAGGVPVHVVFAGRDLSGGLLEDAIGGLGVAEHVTVTGFLTEEMLDAHACAADVIVSLRWPHMGESSGTLMRAFRAGKPVVVQKLGTWAELPPYAVVSVPDASDEAGALAGILDTFRRDPRLRRRTGDAARLYAASVGGPERSAEQYVRAIHEALELEPRSPFDLRREREEAMKVWLGGAPPSLRAPLACVPPAHRGARLLFIGDDEEVAEDALSAVWGYEVERRETGAYEAGSFDVVLVLSGADGSGRTFLSEANRVLRPHGAAVVAGPRPAGVDAAAAGLSDPVALPGGAGWRARKVTLPAAAPLGLGYGSRTRRQSI